MEIVLLLLLWFTEGCRSRIFRRFMMFFTIRLEILGLMSIAKRLCNYSMIQQWVTCPTSCSWKVAAVVGRGFTFVAGQICRLLPDQMHPVELYRTAVAPFETIKNHVREVFDRDVVITRLSNQKADDLESLNK